MNYLWGVPKTSKLSFVLVVSLILLQIPTNSTAAPKVAPGTFCKTYKQSRIFQGKTFVCTKSKKSLVWRQITEVSSASNSETQTIVLLPVSETKTPELVFAPWTTNINQDLLVRSAQNKFREWLASKGATSSDVKFFKDPYFENVDSSWILDLASQTASAFSSYRKPSFNIFLSNTDAWAISTMNRYGIPHPPNGYACGFPAPAKCSDTVNTFSMIIPSIPKPGVEEASQFVEPSHEYFHLVQGQLVSPNRIREDASMPAWFVEGTANFVGYSFLDRAGIAKYVDGRKIEVSRFYGEEPYAPLSDFVENFANQNGRAKAANPYGIGMVATEYLVASIGMDPMLDIFKNMGAGLDFSAAFEKATNFSLSDFYKNFEAIRDNTGITRSIR